MARIKKTTYQTIQENMEIVSVCCWLICFTCFLSHSCTKGSIFFLKEPPQPQPHNSWFCWMFPPNPAACLGFDPSQMGCGVHTAVDTVPACTSSLAIDNPRFSAPTRVLSAHFATNQMPRTAEDAPWFPKHLEPQGSPPSSPARCAHGPIGSIGSPPLASICRKDKVIKQCEREERWFKACDCAERLFSTVRATWTTSGPRKSRSRKVKKRLKF